ncbi:hypothetical protein ACFO3I_02615 [Rheinheimera marina]|uniref:Uncharacterized protein n=1 Tax=Rheinheimera marina TaxID=1774958 RepID=A0ABV9JGV6_9GAMM
MKFASLLTLLLYLVVLFPAQAMVAHEPRVEAKRSTTLVALQAHGSSFSPQKCLADTPDQQKTLLSHSTLAAAEFGEMPLAPHRGLASGFSTTLPFDARAPPV